MKRSFTQAKVPIFGSVLRLTFLPRLSVPAICNDEQEKNAINFWLWLSV